MSTRRGLIGAAIAAPIRLLLGDDAAAQDYIFKINGSVEREELIITDRFGGSVVIPERHLDSLAEHMGFQREINGYLRGHDLPSIRVPYRQ